MVEYEKTTRVIASPPQQSVGGQSNLVIIWGRSSIGQNAALSRQRLAGSSPVVPAQMKISSQQKNKISQITQKYNLEMILLFGSQVNGQTNFDSDFDIAYLPKKKLGGKQKINLNCDFIDVFHNDKIDMVNVQGANPLLKYEISQNSQLLFGDEIDYLNFKGRAYRQYIDAQPLFELQHILVKKRHELLRKSIYD